MNNCQIEGCNKKSRSKHTIEIKDRLIELYICEKCLNKFVKQGRQEE